MVWGNMQSGFWLGIPFLGFASLYESKQALTVLQKQRFVEWFSGKDLDAIWTKTVIVGTGTFAMIDAVDQGFEITVTSGSTNDRSGIQFNAINHYSATASVFLAVARRVTAATSMLVGSNNIITGAFAAGHVAFAMDDTLVTFKNLMTTDGSTLSVSDSDIGIDTLFHLYKIELGSASVKLTIDGVLKVTKTTNRPALAQQPSFISYNQSSTATKSCRIRYMEAYNT